MLESVCERRSSEHICKVKGQTLPECRKQCVQSGRTGEWEKGKKVKQVGVKPCHLFKKSKWGTYILLLIWDGQKLLAFSIMMFPFVFLGIIFSLHWMDDAWHMVQNLLFFSFLSSYFSFFYFFVLKIELRALHMISKHSINELYAQPLFLFSKRPNF